jgi:inner membrane protein
MDSVTQILLGASCAAVVAPARQRRFALALGAALGTLPDLDVLPLALLDDPVARMTWHRSVSHSLLVLLPFGVALWALMRRYGTRVREAPRAWLMAILLALGTHPLLDAHTVYGTQLWWPLPPAPAMWSTVFIIDPLYTLWLLIGVVVALLVRREALAQRALVAGLVLSCAYLGWGWIAKALVDRQFDRALAQAGLGGAPRFSVPMPFTSFVWRGVAMTPEGYVEIAATPWQRSMPALRTRVDEAALRRRALDEVPAAARLMWFAHGFLRSQVIDGELVLSDLRMGLEPDYVFSFAVARRAGERWEPIMPRQLPVPARGWETIRESWRRAD